MTMSTRMQVVTRLAGVILVPTVPVVIWWKMAHDDRALHQEQVRTKVRIPSVTTMDELMIERCCRPGDVVVFDRRCETCATSPLAAMACLMSKQILCDDRNRIGMRTVEHGTFNHCGT
jgi:hypothetical protein